jgi:hypothetical protein
MLTGEFSAAETDAGAVMAGFRFRFAIVMAVVAAAVPADASVALQFTVYEPDCVKLGVPVRVMLGFNTGPAELGPARNAALFVCDSVTVSASGSVADPVTETAVFSVPLTVAGAVITGTRFRFAIVTAVVAVEVRAGVPLSTALQFTEYEPDWLKLGVPVSVMLGFNAGPAEAGPVRNAALFVCDRVTWFASGSVAEPVMLTAVFSVPLTVAGRVMTGAWLPVPIVRAVAAAAVPPAPSFALQLTVKLPVAAGVPVSVMLGFRTGPALLEAVKNGALFVCDRVTF